jgi:hypothetical protein
MLFFSGNVDKQKVFPACSNGPEMKCKIQAVNRFFTGVNQLAGSYRINVKEWC